MIREQNLDILLKISIKFQILSDFFSKFLLLIETGHKPTFVLLQWHTLDLRRSAIK